MWTITIRIGFQRNFRNSPINTISTTYGMRNNKLNSIPPVLDRTFIIITDLICIIIIQKKL